MLCRGLCLVEPGQPAIMPLVKPPVLFDGEPQPAHRLERQVARLDRAALETGEALVEIETLVAQRLTCGPGFLHALRGQIDVPPAGEAVFKIPGRLAVAKQDERGHRVPRARAS